MVEVLSPPRLDISQEFARGFEGMTEKLSRSTICCRRASSSSRRLSARCRRNTAGLCFPSRRASRPGSFLAFPTPKSCRPFSGGCRIFAKAGAKKQEKLIGDLHKSLGIERDNRYLTGGSVRSSVLVGASGMTPDPVLDFVEGDNASSQASRLAQLVDVCFDRLRHAISSGTASRESSSVHSLDHSCIF